jgi:hypothetical protein
MITLMVNAYAEDPSDAMESAQSWLPISRTIECYGRYEGFPDLGPPDQVWESEHAKRNHMLSLAEKYRAPGRWLFWIDCDELVYRASPQIQLQLERYAGNVAGIRFVEPLPPDASWTPGLEDPRRRVRDIVRPAFGLRLYRHLEGLEYRKRHDALWAGDRFLAGQLGGTGGEISPADSVDVEVMHLWWRQPPERLAAKRSYYEGPIRAAEK